MQRAVPRPTFLLVLAAALVLLVVSPAAARGDDDRVVGNVYALTNAAAGNRVAVYERSVHGTLTAVGSVATGGLGTGAGLGSQGALVREGARLFAVNAGSNTISLLKIRRNGELELLDTAPSGGVRPISVTARGHLAYVLNEGGGTTPGSIVGFTALDGELVPLAGSSRPLSAAAAGPAQVEFAPDGRHLVVTEKATNRIVTYAIGAGGLAGAPNAQPSAGQTPFGFAFDAGGRLIVSEAFGGAPDASVVSAYGLAADGTISAISPNVATTETAACWVVVTQNNRFAYATNTGSGSISGYEIGRDGTLTLLDADGRTGVTGPGSAPTDAALSRGSRFLYALGSGTNEIAGFRVRGNGGLDPIGVAGGLPAGAVGLVAD